MTQIATAFDWSTARMTQAAQNTKRPDDRKRVVLVPRSVFNKYHPLPWVEVEAAAARGEDGLEPWMVMTIDRPPANTAYLREGRDTVSLKGRALLFMQGW